MGPFNLLVWFGQNNIYSGLCQQHASFHDFPLESITELKFCLETVCVAAKNVACVIVFQKQVRLYQKLTLSLTGGRVCLT